MGLDVWTRCNIATVRNGELNIIQRVWWGTVFFETWFD